jgi:hypothetical protein
MKFNAEILLKKYFQIVVREFENYKNNLASNSLLVIYRDRTSSQIDYIEITFEGSNYYHLTGLVYKDELNNTSNCGSRFYSDLIDKKLSIDNLKIKDENTELKIRALPFIAAHYKYSNMIGDFNSSGIKLQLDKVIGNTSVCLGLKRIKGKLYAPASCLYDDTRKFASVSHQILAIFIKKSDSNESYSKLKYAAKGVNLHNLKYNEELRSKISLESYVVPNKIISKNIK